MPVINKSNEALPDYPIRPVFMVVLSQYALSPTGIHGVAHWARVLENGRRIAAKTGANLRVIELFSLFHDSKRINDQRDDDHGPRGAEFAKSLRGSLLQISDDEFDQLYKAVHDHTKEGFSDDPTVQACWDADRLDLGRINVHPSECKLGTPSALDPDVQEWAYQRAKSQAQSVLMQKEWGYGLGQASET